MGSKFDMCVDFDELCAIEEDLRKIGVNLGESTERMLLALQSSQGFLAGKQYEKAQKTTMACIDITARTNNNIRNALAYIESLKDAMQKYGQCKYEEGGV